MKLLQTGFDVATPTVTTTQWAIGIFIVVLFAALLVILNHRISYWGLSKAQRATRADVRLALLATVPSLLQLRTRPYRQTGTVGDEGTLREALQTRLDAALDRRRVGRFSARDAGGKLRRTLGVAWRERVAGVPDLTVRALRTAVLVALFGAVAVSTGAIVRLLRADPGTPRNPLARAEALATTAVSETIQLLAAFPYADVLWALGVALAIQTAQFLYQRWYLLAAVLVVGAVAVYYGDRSDGVDVPDRVVQAPRTVLGIAFALGVLVWGVGTAVAGFGPLVVAPQLAELVGFLAAIATGLIALALFYQLRREGLLWVGLAREVRRASWASRAYLVLVGLTTALSAVGLLFILLYAFFAVFDGSARRILTAALAAEREVQGLLAVTVVATIGLTGYAFRAALPDLRVVASRLVGQQVARLQVAAVGVPIGGVAVVYLLAVNILPIAPAIALAIVAGFGLNALMKRGVRFAHGTDWSALLSPPPLPFVTTRVWALEPDAADAPFFVAEVNGTRLAHQERGPLLDDVGTTIEAVADGGTAPETRSKWYAEFLVERGIADVDEMDAKLAEKIRTQAVSGLREQNGEMARERYDRRLDAYPDDAVDAWHAERADFILRGREFVRLLDDPYEQEEEAPARLGERVRERVASDARQN